MFLWKIDYFQRISRKQISITVKCQSNNFLKDNVAKLILKISIKQSYLKFLVKTSWWNWQNMGPCLTYIDDLNRSLVRRVEIIIHAKITD